MSQGIQTMEKTTFSGVGSFRLAAIFRISFISPTNSNV
jgi:hypothetical protein